MGIRIISKPIIISAAATAAAVGMGGYIWREDQRQPILEIYVFALSSGRAVFIRTPEDRRILIDGGGNSDIVHEISAILPFYTRRIDTIIATDDDGKNVSGLIDVISRYDVDRAYISAMTSASLGLASSADQIYPTLIESLKQAKIPIHEAKAGDSIAFGQKVTAKILFPASSTVFAYSNASAPELLMQITYGSSVITLFGDATKKTQSFMASSGASAFTIASSSVLYISQSAASDSLSPSLFDVLGPKYLIYSKAITKASTKPAPSKKKPPIDPLAGISTENRFNLKETGSVLIVSDGISLQMKKAP